MSKLSPQRTYGLGMKIFELRFRDGRGAGFFTTTDVRDALATDTVVQLAVAASASEAAPLPDARRCFEADDVVVLTTHVRSIAYVVEHEL